MIDYLALALGTPREDEPEEETAELLAPPVPPLPRRGEREAVLPPGGTPEDDKTAPAAAGADAPAPLPADEGGTDGEPSPLLTALETVSPPLWRTGEPEEAEELPAAALAEPAPVRFPPSAFRELETRPAPDGAGAGAGEELPGPALSAAGGILPLFERVRQAENWTGFVQRERRALAVTLPEASPAPAWSAEDFDRAVERDARRYGGGFGLY